MTKNKNYVTIKIYVDNFAYLSRFYHLSIIFQSSMFKKISIGLTTFITIVLVASSFFGGNLLQKLGTAQLVKACTAGETLEGDNCTFIKTSTPKYESGCITSYSLMDAICVQANNKTCADFKNSLPAENGLCKVDPESVLIYEIVDFDGRHCNGSDYNLKKYNVGLPRNSQDGIIVCANSFNTTSGKQNFRFYPKSITNTKNIETVVVGQETPTCPAGYVEMATNKCSRPAVAQTCSEGGEVFDGSKCNVCPAGQYCPNNGIISKTMTVCANGGTLTIGVCTAPIKYTVTTYTDGCGTGFVKMDQSCAIIENRTHDTGCSYFYASSNSNKVAILGSDGLCSTGGSVDFNTVDIYKVADLQCNGTGTAYYNYNVSYDPTVCGNDYATVGKAGFKWLPTTFSKITAIQKLPSQSMICPVGWSDNGGNICKQNPITQEFRDPVNCPINTYCIAGSNQPTPCPAGTISPANSKVVTDCTPIPCTNGAINPPVCVTCPINQDFVLTNGSTTGNASGTCQNKCVSGVTRDGIGNCVNCSNGAINPTAGCNTCATGYSLVNGNCIVIIKPSSSSSSSISSVISSIASSSSSSSVNYCPTMSPNCVCPTGQEVYVPLGANGFAGVKYCRVVTNSSSSSSSVSSTISSTINSSSSTNCPTGIIKDLNGKCSICENKFLNPDTGCNICNGNYKITNGKCISQCIDYCDDYCLVYNTIKNGKCIGLCITNKCFDSCPTGQEVYIKLGTTESSSIKYCREITNSSSSSSSVSSNSSSAVTGCERGYTNFPACNQCQADKEVITLNGIQNCVYRCQGTQIRDTAGNCGFGSSSILSSSISSATSSQVNSSSSLSSAKNSSSLISSVVSSNSSLVSSSAISSTNSSVSSSSVSSLISSNSSAISSISSSSSATSSTVSSSSNSSSSATNTIPTFNVTGNIGGVFPNINITNISQIINNNTLASITFTKIDNTTITINGSIINNIFVPNTGSAIPTGIITNANINLIVVVTGYNNINGIGNFTNISPVITPNTNPTQVITINNKNNIPVTNPIAPIVNPIINLFNNIVNTITNNNTNTQTNSNGVTTTQTSTAQTNNNTTITTTPATNYDSITKTVTTTTTTNTVSNTPKPTEIIAIASNITPTTQATTVRTGAFNPFIIITILSSIVVIAFVYFNRRNKKLHKITK